MRQKEDTNWHMPQEEPDSCFAIVRCMQCDKIHSEAQSVRELSGSLCWSCAFSSLNIKPSKVHVYVWNSQTKNFTESEHEIFNLVADAIEEY
jgi:thioredoxin-related protein